MSHFKNGSEWRFLFDLKVRTKVRGPGGRFLPFLLGRAAFMGFRVGYNLVTIVIIHVPTPVGRPKTFDPSIATYVAVKGVPSFSKF